MDELNTVVINVQELYGEKALLSELGRYEEDAKRLAGQGNVIVLTGPGPVWLYLAIAHALHGIASALYYDSPATGRVLIFDHVPF